MSKMKVEDDVVQTIGWFKLPEKIRKVIIDQMPIMSKGRLSSCSRLCLEEVRKSENFIRSLALTIAVDETSVGFRFNKTQMEIKFIAEESEKKNKGSVMVIFRKDYNQKKIWYETGNVAEIAIRYFNSLAKHAQYLEEVSVHAKDLPRNAINLNHLEHLTSFDLHLSGENSDVSMDEIFGFQKLLQMEKCISLSPSNNSIDEILQFKSEKIWIYKNDRLSSADLNRYLKSWKNGGIDENVEDVKFLELKNLNFDLIKRGLGVRNVKEDRGKRVFKMRKGNGQLSDIKFDTTSLSIDLIIERDDDYYQEDFDYDSYIDQWLDDVANEEHALDF